MDRNKYYGAESASLSPLEEVSVCVCVCVCVWALMDACVMHACVNCSTH